MSSIEFTLAANLNEPRRSPRYQPFVLCLACVVAGILIDDRFDFDWRFYGALSAGAFLIWLAARSAKIRFEKLRMAKLGQNRPGQNRPGQNRPGQNRPDNSPFYESATSVSLMIGLIGLGAIWHHGRWNWFGENDISRFVTNNGTPCCIEGLIVSEPRWLEPNDSDDGMNYRPGTVRTRLGFKAKRIRNGTSWIAVSGNLDLVIQTRVRDFRAGDEVRVFGKLIGIDPPSNPGQFDFQEYSRSQRKLVSLHATFPDSVERIKPARRSFLRPLSFLRAELNEIVWRNLNPDEAAFASALMLGNREQLSAERRESFLMTGTSHLLAISGLHVGILAGTFLLFYRLGWLSRNSALLMTIVFVIFYVWLIEFLPPALRSAVLIVTFCIGKLLGKSGFGFNLLALAGLIVLAFNPRDLFNVGAQLSFLAVATLNFGSAWIFWPPSNEPLDRLISSTRSWPVRLAGWSSRQIRAAFLVSASIWFVSLPLVAYHFNLIAPISLLVNPILMLPLAWGLYSGLATLLFGIAIPPLAKVTGRLCEWNLDFIERTIEWGEQVPGGCFASAGPTLPALLVFYVGLFWVAVYPVTRLRFRWIALLSIGWYVCGWWLPDRIAESLIAPRQQRLVCTFIDVNHGSAVLLQMPDGKNILYDAGSFGSSVYGYQSISAVLWANRIERLDTVIISHADLDHYNALPELSQRFGIGELILTQRTRYSRSPSVRILLNQLSLMKIPIRIVNSGDQSDMNKIHPSLSILNPPPAGTGGNDNSDSIVLLVEAHGYRMLLTGDLEGPGLDRMLTHPPLQCDLVMAPHHGSFNSDPTRFMNWSNPKSVVISGETNRIRENSVAVFERNERNVYRTDIHGAIRCTIKPGRVEIENWNGRGWIKSTPSRSLTVPITAIPLRNLESSASQ